MPTTANKIDTPVLRPSVFITLQISRRSRILVAPALYVVRVSETVITAEGVGVRVRVHRAHVNIAVVSQTSQQSRIVHLLIYRGFSVVVELSEQRTRLCCGDPQCALQHRDFERLYSAGAEPSASEPAEASIRTP